jgi:hypothetical protein
MTRVVVTMTLLLTLSASVGAQGRMQNRGGIQPTADAGNLVTLTGQVTGVSMAAGQGFPSFKLLTGGKEVTVMAGPYWLLAAKEFEVKIDSQLTVTAFPSLRQENTYVAVEIKDEATGAVVNLRDQVGGRFGRRGGLGMRGECIYGTAGPLSFDPSRATDLQGTVTSVNMAPGEGYPNFTLKTALGEVTIVTSPFRVVQVAGYRISVGDGMLVTAFPCLQKENTYVATRLQDLTTGETLKLRDDDGTAIRMRGGRASGPGGLQQSVNVIH